MALENRRAGRDREEITLADLQEAIAHAAHNSSTSKSPPRVEEDTRRVTG